MRVAVTGGSGFIGSLLVKELLARGDEVWIITRSTASVRQQHLRLHVLTWEDMAAKPERLEGVQAIVNLAGESINQRWTSEAKRRILKSRLDAAERVAKLVRSLQRKPEVVVNASGISIYGTSETAVFTEESPPVVEDFLGSVVEKWEAAADTIEVQRLVKLRVGLVLGKQGGAYPKMALPYKLFVGGRVGSGKQWLSWIHVEDMVRLIMFCIDNDEVSGPVNATAPEPITNDDFGRDLASTMKRPHWIPVPALLLKLLFGELSSLLLEGQRVIPEKALRLGFNYRYERMSRATYELTFPL